jgi:hypothetical protein
MAGDEARKTRAESRARRRQDVSSAPQPEAVEDETSQEGEDSLGGVKQAAKVAAVGAAVGAATAAARALTHQGREEDEQEEPSSNEPDSGSEDETEAVGQESPVAEDPQGERDEPQDEREEPERVEPKREESQEPIRGAGPDETQAAVREAREQLRSLLGKPAESVSSLERTQDGWLISLEVLELSRVPDTTDVLASYEVELDESCGLRRYARVRRYARSQANGDDR